MKNLLLILLLICSTAFCQEVTINGEIIDAQTGEQLIGVTILEETSQLTEITNSYGVYSLILPKPGTYTIRLSKQGYVDEDFVVEVQASKTENFELFSVDTQLDGVEVVADQNRITLSDPQMSVNQIDGATIQQTPTVLGEADVLKTLELLPGVSTSGEGSAGINIRGGAADQNLVLLDEASFYNTAHLFGLFSVFNADVIKDVKLYKGGIPAEYGGRAAGVLDIRQKEGNNRNFKATGGIGLISSRLMVEGPIEKEKGSFLIGGRSSYAHLLLQASEELSDNVAYFYDLNLKTSYSISDRDKLFLSGYFGKDVIEFDDAFKNTYGNSTLNLRWNRKISKKLFSNLSLIYSRYDYNLTLGFIKLDWLSNITNFNFKYNFEYKISPKLKSKFGTDATYYVFNPGEVRPSEPSSSINPRDLEKKYAAENGLYASIEHKITDKLTATYGLRWSIFGRLGNENIRQYQNNNPVTYNPQLELYESADSVSTTSYDRLESIRTFNNLEPRIALSYKWNAKNAFKANYTRNVQYIHLLSNTTAVTPLDIWTPSGQYIEPQLADQFSLGYFHNFNSNLSFSAETYYRDVQNRIDYIDGAELIAQEAIETQILNGEAQAYGIELLLEKKKGRLTGWVGYTLARAEQRTANPAIGGLGINKGQWYNSVWDRTHDLSVVASYELTPKWRLNGNFVYQTGRPVTYPTGQFTFNGNSIAIYEERNASRLPAYHRLDVSAIYTPKPNSQKRWKSEWVFGIYNLYNRRNAASIAFNQNSVSGNNEAVRTSIFGIVPAITYNFKF